MKTLHFFLLTLCIFCISCRNDDGPVIYLDNTVPPRFLTPEVDSVVLSEEMADMLFPEFSWTATRYDFEYGLANITYSLQMDIEDGCFYRYSTLTNTDTTAYSLTQAAMNTRLLMSDVPYGQPVDVYFRIASYIVSLGSRETCMSEVFKMSITPYQTDITYPPIYLLGDATVAGWDNTKVVEVPHHSGSTFSVIQPLSSSGSLKFIADIGSWVPQWGTNANGTWENGTLVYRAVESDPDPSAIPAPPQDGIYQITVDTLNMLYNISFME